MKMKSMKTLIASVFLTLVAVSAFAGPKGGGGYDFSDGKPLNVMILREAVSSSLKESGCNVSLLVRAIGAAMFESPAVPEKMENSSELTKEEMVCWKKAVAHINRYNDSMKTLFKEEADKE
jgi:hypothetical protein